MLKQVIYIYIFLTVLIASCGRGYQKVLKSTDKDLKYTKAVEYFDREDYLRAMPLLEELVALYRGTKKGAEVYYYYAYCAYNQGDLITASYHFDKFSETYPTNKHAMECDFMNAYCYYQGSPKSSLDQEQTYSAIDALQLFANEYPNSDSIPHCNRLMMELRAKLLQKDFDNAKTYFHVRNYKSAVISLGNVMKDFPHNKYKEEIKYLILQSYYLLAKNSVEGKKEERINATITSYEEFIDEFPKSEDLKIWWVKNQSGVINIKE